MLVRISYEMFMTAWNCVNQVCCDVLKRFIVSYWVPKLVVSDNGLTEKGTLPWQGGVFERSIRSVKRCLSKILLKKTFTYEKLLTTLIHIEKLARIIGCYVTQMRKTKRWVQTGPNNLMCGWIGRNDRFWEVDESVDIINKTIDHFWNMGPFLWLFDQN